jgi:hypothetical protein
MEDAIALSQAFVRHPGDVERARVEYELERQAVVERFQQAAGESAAYFTLVAWWSSRSIRAPASHVPATVALTAVADAASATLVPGRFVRRASRGAEERDSVRPAGEREGCPGVLPDGGRRDGVEQDPARDRSGGQVAHSTAAERAGVSAGWR